MRDGHMVDNWSFAHSVAVIKMLLKRDSRFVKRARQPMRIGGRYHTFPLTQKISAATTKPSSGSTHRAARVVLPGLSFAVLNWIFPADYKSHSARSFRHKPTGLVVSSCPKKSSPFSKRPTISSKRPVSPWLTITSLPTARSPPLPLNPAKHSTPRTSSDALLALLKSTAYNTPSSVWAMVLSLPWQTP
ncbi:2-isopropylmalate synthase [Histoplasma capsulatum G186AR]|uniref:2-isopropylmalate synthase n=1 Tax=Ajellomyces capsulatus TaxID=5037 RepID=A0A8H8D2Q2_AJECA|nr:2-isopropylmalate synthase [Histoplasma capsulatum]QSS73128.1 2-isopropylmalate synthase [Histoplasma capsulatum G186AR]